MNGTVLAGTNNIFEVECSDGIIRNCSIKGKVLKSDTEYYNPLAPGDVVEIEVDQMDDNKGQVLSLVPRKNQFVRWNVKGRCPQLLAANVDYMILVTTPDEPPFRPRFIDRELAQAEMLGLTPVIVCNKYDLIDDKPDVEEYLKIWEDLGYRVMRVSAKTGEGISEFIELIRDRLSAFVGQSGVGKSSLVNVLDDSCVLKTGSLSKKYGRGSHTTTKGTLNNDGYVSVARQLKEKFGFKKVAITLRSSINANRNDWQALLYVDDKDYAFSKKYEMWIVDRVGGGDSFGGGLIHSQLKGMNTQDSINWAVAASCLKHSIIGDYNMVSEDEVNKLAGGDGSGRIQR